MQMNEGGFTALAKHILAHQERVGCRNRLKAGVDGMGLKTSELLLLSRKRKRYHMSEPAHREKPPGREF